MDAVLFDGESCPRSELIGQCVLDKAPAIAGSHGLIARLSGLDVALRRPASRCASQFSAWATSSFIGIFLAKTERRVMIFGNEDFVQPRTKESS
jgi:hypothetical protein